MSFALENKHKQSRENIDKTNNNLGQAKKPWENQKKTILRDSWLDPPLSSRLPPNCSFCFPKLFFVFLLFLGCYWFSQGFFVVLVFLFRSICVLTISFNLQVCEPKSHLKAYVLCSYNESV